MSQIIVSVSPRPVEGGVKWVTRREAPSPVQELFISCGTFADDVEAIQAFQDTSELIGWDNMTLEVRRG